MDADHEEPTLDDTDRGDLADEVGKLQGSVKELARVTALSNKTTIEAMRRRTRLEKIVLGACAVVILGMVALGVGLWQVHSAQDDASGSARATRGAVDAIRSAQADSRETLRVIRDCTDPSGECSKRGVESQGKAVGDIGKLSILASWCVAQHPHDLAAAESCVATTKLP